MKKEVEILFELKESEESAIAKLGGFELVGKKQVVDTYYYDPLRENLKGSETGRLKASFRLRDKEGKYSLAYKVDHFKEDEWLYSDEHETEVQDLEEMSSIIEKLGLETLVVVNVQKHIFKNETFEVLLEKVENLGSFIEVEYHFVSDDQNIEEAKEYIRSWIRERGIQIGQEFNAGKPELLLRKRASK